MSEGTTMLGVEDPARLFGVLGEAGDEDLVSIRDQINEHLGESRFDRPARTWGASAAAELIGRSVAWLRENDPDAPKNSHGHARWDLARINEIRDRIGTRYRRPSQSKPLVSALAKLKGGVGNSTLCAHYAHYLAIQGLKVLAVDLDPQASLTQLLGAIVADVDLQDDEDIPLGALLDDPSQFRHSIRKTYFHNVDLCPSNQSLQDLDIGLIRQMLNGEVGDIPVSQRLKVALDTLGDDYDAILIDCAPQLGMATANAIGACNCLITPIRPSQFDRASYVSFCHSLSSFFDTTGQSLDYYRIVLNQCQETLNDKLQENDLRSLYGGYVCTNTMSRSAEILNSAAQLSTVYDLERPTSNRETYKRAISGLDGIFDEMFADLKTIWEGQAHAE